MRSTGPASGTIAAMTSQSSSIATLGTMQLGAMKLGARKRGAVQLSQGPNEAAQAMRCEAGCDAAHPINNATSTKHVHSEDAWTHTATCQVYHKRLILGIRNASHSDIFMSAWSCVASQMHGIAFRHIHVGTCIAPLASQFTRKVRDDKVFEETWPVSQPVVANVRCFGG